MLGLNDSYRGVKFVLRHLREISLAWFVLGIGIARVGMVIGRAFSAKRHFIWLRRCAFAAGLLVFCTYLAISLDSLHWFMIQQDEANIISISAASLRGLPMYHPPDSTNFSYSLMYGPFTFLIYCVALVAGGVNHFWIMRGAVVMAALLLCAALFILLRRFVSAITAVALLAFPLSILLQHPEVSLSIRADIWIILFTALAILSSFLEVGFLAVYIGTTRLFKWATVQLTVITARSCVMCWCTNISPTHLRVILRALRRCCYRFQSMSFTRWLVAKTMSG